jgi:hypothetical protein
MKIKEIKEGVTYFTERRVVDDVFTVESLDLALERNKKMLEELDNAIMSAKGNMELNALAVDAIRENRDLTTKEIAGAEIYYRSVKDLAEMEEARPKYLEGIEAIKKILDECKETLAEETEEVTEEEITPELITETTPTENNA